MRYIWVDDLEKNNCEFIVYHDDSFTDVDIQAVTSSVCSIVDNMLDNGYNEWEIEDI